MKRWACGLALVALLGASVACDGGPPRSPAAGAVGSIPPSSPAAPAPAPSPSAPSSPPAALAAALNDTALVGQLLMPYAYGSDATHVSAAAARANRRLGGVDTPAALVAKYHLGGLILVAGVGRDPDATTNVASATQVRRLTAGLQAAAGKLPLLIGTDQEYGVVTRLRSGVLRLPSALAIGAAARPALTRAAWAAAGADLAGVGINVDFAPDADVLARPGNTVIGSRSFGGSPAAVSGQVAAAVTGLQSAGVAATLKHFPGHGDTDTDSHVALPVLHQSLARLTADDLAPFRAGIAAGADLVMSGHLDVTALDPGVPASFSHKVLTDVLRTQTRFSGVVITDALDMAPARRWSPGEAAVRAIQAGNDVLLMPPDIGAAQRGLLAALASGRLSRARLVESATRIITLKQRLAAAAHSPSVAATRSTAAAAGRSAVARLAAAAVTVLRGPCAGTLAPGPLTVVAAGGRSTAPLVAALRAAGRTVVDRGGAVIDLVGYGADRDDLATGAAITVAMDTPYILAGAASPIRLATYSSGQASMTALAAVIAGKAKAVGRSPVAVAGLPRSAC
jgi:beta-N-acetylhexosaminidase